MNKVMTATFVLAASVLTGCVADPYYGDRDFYGRDGAHYSDRSHAPDRAWDNGGYPERRPDRYESRRYGYYR